MSHYKHLTPFEREKIYLLYEQNKTMSFIAQTLGRHKSTISRELRRNTGEQGYSPSAAQEAYLHRRILCKPKPKLADPIALEYVREKFLKQKWSPEQIAGRLKLEQSNLSISDTTIYRGIYAGLFDTAKERSSIHAAGAGRIHAACLIPQRSDLPVEIKGPSVSCVIEERVDIQKAMWKNEEKSPSVT